MTLNDRPRQTDDAVGRVIDDTFFVLHGGTSELHHFNAIGRRIWELCDGETTVAQIAATLVDEYDVEQAEAEADALAFVDQLAAKQLLR
jgi:hypothetical protein